MVTTSETTAAAAAALTRVVSELGTLVFFCRFTSDNFFHFVLIDQQVGVL
jgi:hypothetical protein